MSTNPRPNRSPARRLGCGGMVIVAVVTAALAGYGSLEPHASRRVLAETTNELAAPTVIVAAPKPGAPVTALCFPAT